ncbi:MAG: SphA family protein [Candidatus Rokuibacteriota bacterium]
MDGSTLLTKKGCGSRTTGAARVRWRALELVLVVAAAMISPSSALAGELSHYFPGAVTLRGFFVPPKGVYASLSLIGYHSDSLRDRNGEDIDTIVVRGQTVKVDAQVDTYSIAPILIWSSGWKPLGLDYAAILAVPVGGGGYQAALSRLIGSGLDRDESPFGLQDIYVQPLWLGREWRSFELAGSYGFSAPTGKFEPGAADNTGLGFWGHQFRVSGAWYPLDQKRLGIITAVTYELNQKKEGQDLTPGSHLTLNYGVSRLLWAGRGVVEVGFFGYSQWQVTDDRGADVPEFTRGVRDEIHVGGAQLGYTFLPQRLNVTGKYLYEYYAEDRFRGHIVSLAVAYKF